MKILSALVLALLLSGCVGMSSPKETGIAVSALLEQLQEAIDDIGAKSKGSSLPPLQSAEVTLSTATAKEMSGGAELVLSAGAKRASAESNTLTLVLTPRPVEKQLTMKVAGRQIADYVNAAVQAIDSKKTSLVLKKLVIEAGFEVTQTTEGGIKVDIGSVGVKAGGSKEVSDGHSLKLVFAMPEKT